VTFDRHYCHDVAFRVEARETLNFVVVGIRDCSWPDPSVAQKHLPGLALPVSSIFVSLSWFMVLGSHGQDVSGAESQMLPNLHNNVALL
jgi:hypothetical protein